MNRIAVIMPKWIGDFIMALAVVEKKREREHAEIALLTAPYLIGTNSDHYGNIAASD